MTLQEQVENFLAGERYAVIGASRNRRKYGNKVLRVYLQNDREAIPINPRADEIEGVTAYPDLASLPEPVHGISIITPPNVTESVVEEAGRLGIKHIWMQPGAENATAIARAEELGMNVIAGGPCLLVVLAFHE